MKTKVQLIAETPEKVVLKFPSIDIPVDISRQYFKKILNSKEYEVERLKSR